MHSSLRCLFRLRLHAPSLRRHLLRHASTPPCHARTLRVPMMCRSSPPRVSFTSSFCTGIHPHLASFDSPSGDEEGEEDEEEGSKRRGRSVVSSYYDPVQDRVVTVSQRVEDSVESVSQVGTSNREFDVEEEKGKKSGLTIWERSRKLRAKEERTASSKISSGVIKRKGKSSSKDKVVYQCESCGSELSQWWGVCPKCGGGPVSQCVHEVLEVNPKRGAEVSEAVVRTWLRQKPGSMVPKTLADINTGRDQAEWRIPL